MERVAELLPERQRGPYRLEPTKTSEELDPIAGEQLGNFPQAFSHSGHIQSSVLLARQGLG